MPGFDDLCDQLELPQCHCLNAATSHVLRDCLAAESREDNGKFLQSDCDEQLLISLKFMSAVKVSAIIVQATDDVDAAPASLKLFVNKTGLDFDSAESDKPTQEIELAKADVASGSKVDVHFVKFQSVQELGIFIPGNLGGGEETKIAKLAVLGECITHSGLKRSAEEQASASKADWLGKGIS